jgi:hypothetical protein
MMPTAAPITIVIMAAVSPTTSDTREPSIVSASTDRPSASVPSGLFALGGHGSVVKVHGAMSSSVTFVFTSCDLSWKTEKIAIPMKKIMRTRPIMPSVLRR